jgi:hypothetical protein
LYTDPLFQALYLKLFGRKNTASVGKTQVFVKYWIFIDFIRSVFKLPYCSLNNKCKTALLLFVLCWCQVLPLTLREEHRENIAEKDIWGQEEGSRRGVW